MSGETFVKHPSETYPIGVDYTGKAPTGAVLTSGVWSATDQSDNSDATGAVLFSATAVIEGGVVAKVRVQSGTNGVSYKLGLTATFDTGDVLHDNLFMFIDDSG